MSQIILLNKPFRVLSQFSAHEQKTTLKEYIPIDKFYPCGRLDFDSEGLLILSNNGSLQTLIAHPKYKMEKTYWVQVEGDVSTSAIEQLKKGVTLKDGKTKPAKVKLIAEPNSLWKRTPPIRERANIPTSWLEIIISEGKNRQVRRMTATVGHPTLRLIRTRIGPWDLDKLKPGDWCYANPDAALKEKLSQLESNKLQRKSYKHHKPNTNQKQTNARGPRRRSP